MANSKLLFYWFLWMVALAMIGLENPLVRFTFVLFLFSTVSTIVESMPSGSAPGSSGPEHPSSHSEQALKAVK